MSTGQGGKGGTLQLTATGTVTSQSGLSVDGGAMFGGGGGRIEITTGSALPFLIGNGPSSNGINGTLTARGSDAGAGGVISIKSLGAGMTLGAAAVVSVTSPVGNSGAIVLEANGALSILAPSLTTSAAVGDGGLLTLTGKSITGPASGALLLTANGGTLGRGGAVVLRTTATDATGSITTGNGTGQVSLEAKGGTVVGGTIDIGIGGPNLIVNVSGLTVRWRQWQWWHGHSDSRR